MAKKLTQNVYWDKQYKLTDCPKFLYEVSLYKIWKDRIECCGSQFYAADKPLTIKKETVIKKVEDYKLVKYTIWLAAPLDYMLNNGFTLYDETDRKGKSRSNKSTAIRRGERGRNVKGRP